MKRVIVTILLLFLAGCASELPPEQYDWHPCPQGEGIENAHWTGTASWYGTIYHGRKTASGAIYDKRALTAAHRTLPFGTSIHVTSLETGKSVALVVNDRGPYCEYVGSFFYPCKHERELDVSEAAAEVLGFKEAGLAEVEIAMLETP